MVVSPPRGHGWVPRVAAGPARGSMVRGPGAGGFLLPVACIRCGELVEAGGEDGDRGFPGDGVLVPVACGFFGRAFWARLERRCRPGTFRTCSAARAAPSVVAVIASSDEVAVTWVDSMERSMRRRAAVKDSPSAVTGRRPGGAARRLPPRCAARRLRWRAPAGRR